MSLGGEPAVIGADGAMGASSPHVVVLGAGFAGVSFCRAFPRGCARITLVDRSNYHLFQPLLYQVATTGLSAEDIAKPIRAIFRDRDDLTVIMARVEDADLDARTVSTSAGELLYDYLVIAMGSRTSYFKSPHWQPHAPGLKTIEDALEIRRRLLLAFEEAEYVEDETLRRELATVVVVGGGPTGVELAGSIAELARHVIPEDFRRFDPTKVRVVLVEGGERILPTYSTEASEAARRQLENLHVEVQTGVLVSSIGEHEVVLDDETIRARTIIWAAGVAAVEIASRFGAPVDRSGRLLVHRDLSLPGHPEAFAAGDLVHLTDEQGGEIPGVAPAAKQMGTFLAELIAGKIRGEALSGQRSKFVYREVWRMATVGRSAAVAEFRQWRFSGFFAWFSWLAIHLVFLMGMRNRLSVFASWVYSYFARRHRARIIIGRPSEGAAETEDSDRTETARRSA